MEGKECRLRVKQWNDDAYAHARGLHGGSSALEHAENCHCWIHSAKRGSQALPEERAAGQRAQQLLLTRARGLVKHGDPRCWYLQTTTCWTGMDSGSLLRMLFTMRRPAPPNMPPRLVDEEEFGSTIGVRDENSSLGAEVVGGDTFSLAVAWPGARIVFIESVVDKARSGSFGRYACGSLAGLMLLSSKYED